MNKAKYMAAMLTVAVSVLGLSSAEAAEVAQQAVLNGKVVSTVSVNTPVKEGDVLVSVDSLVGAMPAVRAGSDGVVKEVRVVVGDTITKQEVVVILETGA